MIIEATAVGTLHTIKSGGIEEEARRVSPSVITHMGYRWCAHPSSTLIEAMWVVGAIAPPPLTTQGKTPPWAK